MSNSSTGFTTTTTTDQSTTTTTTSGAAVVSSNSPSPDHNLFFPSSPAEQLCYVHCTFCDTVLAVSVPCSSLFKTVTVRCGHCSNLLSVNMRALLLPSPATAGAPAVAPAANHHPQLHQFNHSPFFTSPHNLLDEIRNSSPNLLMNHHQTVNNHHEQLMPVPGVDYHDLPKPPLRRRDRESHLHTTVSSRKKSNWAHFPHIHFGLMPDHQPVKKANMRQQDGEDHVLMKDGFLAASNNIGVSPY
ncbi:hypothetical protein V2J09_015231 [Rumex salicifolius]